MVALPGQASEWDAVVIPTKQTSTFVRTAGSPARLDMTTVRFDQSKLYSSAIYERTGDTLVYCVAAPGRATPTAFATRQNDGCTLVTLKSRVISNIRK